MGPDRGRRYEQRFTDFAIGHSLRELCRDHQLPIRQAGERIAYGAKHRSNFLPLPTCGQNPMTLRQGENTTDATSKILRLHDSIRRVSILASAGRQDEVAWQALVDFRTRSPP